MLELNSEKRKTYFVQDGQCILCSKYLRGKGKISEDLCTCTSANNCEECKVIFLFHFGLINKTNCLISFDNYDYKVQIPCLASF